MGLYGSAGYRPRRQGEDALRGRNYVLDAPGHHLHDDRILEQGDGLIRHVPSELLGRARARTRYMPQAAFTQFTA